MTANRMGPFRGSGDECLAHDAKRAHQSPAGAARASRMRDLRSIARRPEFNAMRAWRTLAVSIIDTPRPTGLCGSARSRHSFRKRCPARTRSITSLRCI